MKRRTFLLSMMASACRPRAPQANTPADQTVPRVQPDRPENVPNPLRLGLMPVLEPEVIRAQFAPLAGYLGRTLGTKVELSIAKDYAGAIDNAIEGRVDIAQLSPLAYVAAKDRLPALYPLAANISEGSSTYSGYLIARRTLKIRSPQQLKGRRLGLINLHSASGYLYPYSFLLERGVDPAKDCTIDLHERHDRLLNALSEGTVDVGGTFSGALNHAEQQGVDIRGLEIIAKTGRIPHDAWVAHPTLDPALHNAAQFALLNLSTRTHAGRLILAPIQSINAFTEVSDAHYHRVRAVQRRVSNA